MAVPATIRKEVIPIAMMLNRIDRARCDQRGRMTTASAATAMRARKITASRKRSEAVGSMINSKSTIATTTAKGSQRKARDLTVRTGSRRPKRSLSIGGFRVGLDLAT